MKLGLSEIAPMVERAVRTKPIDRRWRWCIECGHATSSLYDGVPHCYFHEPGISDVERDMRAGVVPRIESGAQLDMFDGFGLEQRRSA